MDSGSQGVLREWSADDDEMSFSASDRFEDLGELYRRGKYSSEGISLYDLAVDVLNDAGVDSREYWLDDYLKNVKVYNPMPVVSHQGSTAVDCECRKVHLISKPKRKYCHEI